MKKHYETHVEDTDKLISVAGPVLDYKSWYEQYRKLMEEQAQRKYGLYTPTSEGDDDFPSITGMIARYSALGFTNEEMSKNPVWVDKTGNGHDLQMKNFFWGGMSGVGGYVDNWNSSADWAVNSYWVNSHTDHKLQFITASTVVQVKSKNVYNAENVYKNILNVNGLTEAVNKGAVSSLEIFVTDSITSKVIKIFSFETDGVIQISFDDVLQDYYVNYFVMGNNTNDIDITIEQLPLYPGALVFDGVDDYGTCDNFPILTKEKGYTVVALRQWITRGKGALGLVSNVKNWLHDGAFLLEYRNIQADHLNKPISFGAIGSEMDLPHILTYQTSKSYNGVSITTGNFEGTDVLHVGKLAPTNVGTCINAAIWELVFLDHDATEEELTKIKDYFVKTYPWLFPDQAWTVVGKTNEDEDRATIANITGNGNDLILSNFGFIEGSGYNEEGEYAGYLVTDGVDDEVRSAAFTLNEDWTIVGNWEFITNENKNAGLTKVYSLYLYNRDYGIFVYKYINAGQGFSVENVKSLKAICSDGRIYLNDWQEIRNNIEQEATISKGVMAIGYFNRDFTKMAFKNLGIYNNQILSKDECIKAYNYLQTLKSK